MAMIGDMKPHPKKTLKTFVKHVDTMPVSYTSGRLLFLLRIMSKDQVLLTLLFATSFW